MAATKTGRKRLRLKGFDYQEAGCSYFLTICATHHAPSLLTAETVKAVEISLAKMRALGALVHCYCLMPDHIHLLISLADYPKGVTELVRGFKTTASRRAGRPLWQRSFHDHILRPSENPEEVCRYILGNPIRKGLATDFGQWPYGKMLDPL